MLNKLLNWPEIKATFTIYFNLFFCLICPLISLPLPLIPTKTLASIFIHFQSNISNHSSQKWANRKDSKHTAINFAISFEGAHFFISRKRQLLPSSINQLPSPKLLSLARSKYQHHIHYFFSCKRVRERNCYTTDSEYAGSFYFVCGRKKFSWIIDSSTRATSNNESSSKKIETMNGGGKFLEEQMAQKVINNR